MAICNVMLEEGCTILTSSVDQHRDSRLILGYSFHFVFNFISRQGIHCTFSRICYFFIFIYSSNTMSDTRKSGQIRFLSWNIKGIHNPVKRSRVFAQMKTLGSDIIFLRETLLRFSECTKLKKPWTGQLFCSKNEDRVCGTAIMIKKDISFTPLQTVRDPRGRYVIVTGQVTLANIYEPNWGHILTSLHYYQTLIATN